MKTTRKEMTDHTGSTFDSFLVEQHIREEVEAVAAKRVISWLLSQKAKNSEPPKAKSS